MSDDLAAAMALHRDENGRGLLVGPNCPDCQRPETVTYVCTSCDACWDVPGRYVWKWQGKNHFHDADDSAVEEAMLDHAAGHGPGSTACIVPLSMRPRRAEQDGPDR